MATKTEEAAATVLKMLQYEAEQFDRRINWLGRFQGFLLAALAFAWDKETSIVLILASTGALAALLILFGLIAGTLAVWRIRKHWFDHNSRAYNGPEYPLLQPFLPKVLPRYFYLPAETLLPLVFIAVWFLVLCVRLPA